MVVPVLSEPIPIVPVPTLFVLVGVMRSVAVAVAVVVELGEPPDEGDVDVLEKGECMWW